MVRKLVVIYLCLCSVLMFAETGTGTKYRVATIVAVNPHAAGANAGSSAQAMTSRCKLETPSMWSCTLHA